MKSKIIIGILIIGLLVIAGCRNLEPIPGVQTLKQYYEHKEGEQGSLEFPLDSAARAKILSIRLCKDVKLPEGVSNDCGIFGGDTITLQDNEDEDVIQEYSFTWGQAPYYLAEVLQIGDECQFTFDKYVYGNIERVRYCDNVSDEQIEEARKAWEGRPLVLSPVLSEGGSQEYGGHVITLVKVNDDGSIIVKVDGGDYLTIKKGSELVDKNCLGIKNEWTENRPMGKVAAMLIEEANLCNDAIGNVVPDGNLRDDVVVNFEPEGNLKDDVFVNPESKITKNEAIKIAKNAGLEGNPDDWRVQYYLYTSLNIYVWSVENTLSSTGSGQSYSASGKSTIINAETGELITQNNWMMIA